MESTTRSMESERLEVDALKRDLERRRLEAVRRMYQRSERTVSVALILLVAMAICAIAGALWR